VYACVCVCVCVCAWSQLHTLYTYKLYLSPIGYKEDDTFRRQTIDIAEKIHTTSETELTVQRTSQSERVCLFVFLSFVSYKFNLNLLRFFTRSINYRMYITYLLVYTWYLYCVGYNIYYKKRIPTNKSKCWYRLKFYLFRYFTNLDRCKRK